MLLEDLALERRHGRGAGAVAEDDEACGLARAERELGPVVAAFLFASRAGSAITAEIGDSFHPSESQLPKIVGQGTRIGTTFIDQVLADKALIS